MNARGHGNRKKKSGIRSSHCIVFTFALCLVYFLGLIRGMQVAHGSTLQDGSFLEPFSSSVTYIDDDGYFDDDGGDGVAVAGDDEEKSARPKKFSLPDLKPRFPHPEHLKLPKPIINVGLPKAGTSTIFNFFHCNGLRAQHWYCCEEQLDAGHTAGHTNILMSRCLLKNIYEGRPIFDECGDYEVYTEINGPRMLQGFENPDFNGRNVLDDGTIESRQQTNKKPRILLPQHHYLDRIHEQYPNATFILNLRPVDEWVESVIKWPSTLKLEVPNEFFAQQLERNFSSTFDEHIHPARSPMDTPALLRYFFDYHSQHVREFVEQHPSHTLIEVDITDDSSGTILADAFGLNETCWGHFNKNKGKNKKMRKKGITGSQWREMVLKKMEDRQSRKKGTNGLLDDFKDRRRARLAGQRSGLGASLRQFTGRTTIPDG